jgi:hypothetical protein
MTPLIYVFAGVAVALAVGFLVAASLSFVHAGNRNDRADDLRLYLETPFDPSLPTSSLVEDWLRPRLMQITMGDVIRDEELAEALRFGLHARRSASMRSNNEGEPPVDAPTD